MRLAILIAAMLAAALISPAFAAEKATIEIVAHVNHTNLARLPPAGRAGDADSSYWIVRDRHARAIGDIIMSCRWVTSALRLCVGQATMPLGTLAVIGASRTALIGQFAIVGGTGEYTHATGTVLFKATGARTYVVTADYQQ